MNLDGTWVMNNDPNDLDCFVCQGVMSPFFTKDFGGRCSLRCVDYYRCNSCGLVLSKTHEDMPQEQWEELNIRYHSAYQSTMQNEDDPRWLERLHAQAAAIANLAHNDLLPRHRPWVDYACGDGKLADLLERYGLLVARYDRYMMCQGVAGENKYLSDADLVEGRYGLVINTSFFEHVRSISALDEVVELVAQDGVLALHALVREAIPPDPTWFYLLPVHSTFFTNRSMEILFARWRFKASIYHLESRMWFWFRHDDPVRT